MPVDHSNKFVLVENLATAKVLGLAMLAALLLAGGTPLHLPLARPTVANRIAGDSDS
jgi:hypothetical protein